MRRCRDPLQKHLPKLNRVALALQRYVSVGHPTAVNPDPELRANAIANEWRLRDFRHRARIKPYVAPVASGATGIAVGLASGYLLGQMRGRR